MKIKSMVVAISMCTCVSAFADTTGGADLPATQISQLFNITADVNSMLQLTAVDGSPLDPNVSMRYSLLRNSLDPVEVDAVLATNATANNIVATMPLAAVLYSGTNTIPLTVTMNGKTLGTSDTEFDAKTLFTAGNSGAVNFKFAPTDPTVKLVQGAYKGTVTLYLEQQTPVTPAPKSS